MSTNRWPLAPVFRTFLAFAFVLAGGGAAYGQQAAVDASAEQPGARVQEAARPAARAKVRARAPAPRVIPGVEPAEGRLDERVRTVIYRPDEVIRLRGGYGYAMSVEFADDEAVQSMSVGDSVAWQVIPRRNVLFIKPQEDNASTNMLVHTTRRVYSFSLVAFKPTSPMDERLTYRIRFRYPDEEASAARQAEEQRGLMLTREMHGVLGAETAAAATGVFPASRAKSPTAWNFSYSFKGSSVAAPIQMIDDGEFTYVRFADNDNIPAVFMVDGEGQETLLNFRREGDWLVIERVAQRFTFRASNNTEVACIYNDGFPQRPPTTLRQRK